MRIGFVMAIALTALAFSGCTSAGTQVTAKEAVGKATEIAQAWNPQAILVGVTAMEAKSSMSESQAAGTKGSLSAALLSQTDSHVGDGKAANWQLDFRAADKQLTLVVDASGKEQYRNETSQFAANYGPVGNWTINSDQAASIANANKSFEDRLATANVVVVNLQQIGNAPYWSLGASTSFGNGVVVVIDANSGAVLSLDQVLTMAANLLGPQEKGRASGSVNVAAPDITTTFELKDAHQRLNFTLSTQTPGSVNTVTATVKGPNGNVTKLDAAGSTPTVPPTFPPTSAAPVKVTLAAPLVGTYTVSFHLTGGASQSARLDYCTDGQPAPATSGGGGRGGQSNPAC